MISNILVATDDSNIANKALKYAVNLASQLKASITLLTVIDDRAFIVQSIPAEMFQLQVGEPIGDFMKRAAEKSIERAGNMCKKNGITCKQVIRNGHPVDEIIKEAKKSKVDMIVMGSHGRGTIESAVLGSVTYGVIHKNTKYPVLVIRK